MRIFFSYFFLFLCIPAFSGCFWEWGYSSSAYKNSLQSMVVEVNAVHGALSSEIEKSSLKSENTLRTEEVNLQIAKLKTLRTSIESLPAFRGDESYRNNLLEWVDATLSFFEKDIVQFLAAPSQASTSDELQGTVQSLYEATKRIKEAKKKVEDQIEGL